MEPEEAVRRHGGVATTAQLRGARVSSTALALAVTEDRLRRIRRGFYASPAASRSAVVAVRVGGRLAGLSALQSYGAWGGWSTQVHVSVPGNAGRVRTVPPPAQRRPGHPLRDDLFGREVELHWRDDPEDLGSCWRVSVERALSQVVRWHDGETALACLETALSAGIVTRAGLARLADAGSERMARLVEGCRDGVGSGVESIARQRLERRGLELTPQEVIPNVGRVDLVVAGSRVVIETDGFRFHSSRTQFDEDRRRDAEAIVCGWVPLRFSATQVRDDWPWVESTVLATLARARG